MKTRLLAMMLLAGGTMFAETNFYFGIGIGTPRPGRFVMQPPPPPPVRFVRSPGRNFVWVPGYWVWAGNRYAWQDGYWTKQKKGRGNGWRNGR